jgi:hypothetical protein
MERIIKVYNRAFVGSNVWKTGRCEHPRCAGPADFIGETANGGALYLCAHHAHEVDATIPSDDFLGKVCPV